MFQSTAFYHNADRIQGAELTRIHADLDPGRTKVTKKFLHEKYT